jgi:F-type H+-transporting ATPase subunit gamma
MRRVLTWLGERKEQGVEVELRVFGRKGRDFCGVRGVKVEASVIDYVKTPKMQMVAVIGETAVRGFVGGDYDEVWIASNVFKSASTQIPTFAKVLPLAIDANEAQSDGDYSFEPDAGTLLDSLLPLYVRTLFLQAFLDTEAGEYASRMMAMDAATRNAGELTKSLTLQYNRARQAAITTEITEIVSGAEAL